MDEQRGVIRDVSDTAFMVAHHRAVESARPDALFYDPFAARLAGARGKAIAESSPVAAMTAWILAVRTVVIDRLVEEALARGVNRVVNLGAGLDARPHRMSLPAGLEWIEVDHPHVIEFKKQALSGEPTQCRLERVGVDLTDTEARRAIFVRLDAAPARTLVVTEGVVPYLDLYEAGALADDLRAWKTLDSWIVDYVSPDGHNQRQRRAGRHMQKAPFKFAPPDWFAFFAKHGFVPSDERYLPIEGAKMGRRPPLPPSASVLIALFGRFAPPEKRARFEKFSGYIVLKPSAATKAIPEPTPASRRREM